MARTEESAMVSLVEKLAAWVEAQPEYAVLFLAGRARRRRAARIVAYRLFILPTVKPQTEWNRKSARKAVRTVRKMNGAKLARFKRRNARLEQKYQTQFERYARMSVRRMNRLAEEGDVLAAAMLQEGETP